MSQIKQHIDMCVGPFQNAGTANTYTIFPEIRAKLNTADFDGTILYYFEVDLLSLAVGGTAYAELYNATDSTSVSSSEVSIAYDGNSSTKRIRSGAISLSGDKEYTIRVKHDITNLSNAVLYGARIIVVQSGTITKTQIQIELGVEANASSTSTSNILDEAGTFLYEASKYDGSVTIRHDAVIKSTSGNTTSSGIYDVTAAGVISSSTVSTTSTSYSTQSVSYTHLTLPTILRV